MTLTIHSVESLPEVAAEFLRLAEGKRIFAFHGSMGAGKTTFTKALCDCLGVCDTVNSPTFAIVNEYADTAGDVVAYHFDFYRIKKEDEVLDIGFEDYVNSGNVCFMEWPELIGSYLPDETVKVYIEEREDGSRIIMMDAEEEEETDVVSEIVSDVVPDITPDII